MMAPPVPLPVERAIRKLGNDISLARRRRHISRLRLPSAWARRYPPCAGWKRATSKVPIHFFARALHVFGEIRALEHLLDTPNDEIGLTLMDEHLPKRIRSKSGGPSGAL